jgi:hypothetical protein
MEHGSSCSYGICYRVVLVVVEMKEGFSCCVAASNREQHQSKQHSRETRRLPREISDIGNGCFQGLQTRLFTSFGLSAALLQPLQNQHQGQDTTGPLSFV